MKPVPVRRIYWVPRYCFGDRLRHLSTGERVLVKDFQYQEHYTIDELVTAPAYLVIVLNHEREAWVAEDELGERWG